MPTLLLIAQSIVLTLSYLGLALGNLPGLRMNRATTSSHDRLFLGDFWRLGEGGDRLGGAVELKKMGRGSYGTDHSDE